MNLGLGLFLGARGGGGSFDPSQLANVAHWYRSDLGVTLNAGNVSQWNDQVGTAHLVQANGANQPAYNATDAAYGNQATIQASTTGKYLACAGIATAQPLTLWIVGNITVASTVLVALSTSGPWIAYHGSTSWSSNAGTTLFGDTTTPPDTKRAILATFNGASSFVAADNWLTAGLAGNAGTNNGTSIGVFGTSSGTFTAVGKIAELIIQAGVPTAAEKANMAKYFARYGINVT